MAVSSSFLYRLPFSEPKSKRPAAWISHLDCGVRNPLPWLPKSGTGPLIGGWTLSAKNPCDSSVYGKVRWPGPGDHSAIPIILSLLFIR